ncbi:two-component system, OmpR family, phosphate regulon sensor histidine kinase PhoR [Lebetimonas natsushimae]|uniref:histidine kinase n=1 Tax=Lebetimonas natsushimae TaxID=1936991 RepID=A0A292YCN6_9BACT|nr:HAMP domain-containing sensor histidine kinase [Lebetimonas natsushimae]GAX87787.1 two-component system, OmpR family, phosphate regulon sensor histidine kinase PhoR [Lebetimonas natsushimae]
MFKVKKDSLAKVFFHDLKNKLFSIKFNLFLLLNKKLSPEKEKDILQKISITTEESIDLVLDYLELDQYKKERFLNYKNINLGDLIEKVINELQTETEKKNITIYFTKKDACIKADEKWLKKAIYNILHNAIKYNKQNGKIIILIDENEKNFLITIKDTGIGISKEEQKEIFKRYFTTDKTGSGIGLNFVKAVIKTLGGKIYFESEKNKGTSFYILLPKIAKKIKIQQLTLAMSSFILISSLIINYFFCFFPQNIKYKTNGNIKIAMLENGVFIKSYINDKYKIKAYKNLFSNKFKTKIIISRADTYIKTNGNKIKVISPYISLKNLGTEFETNVKKETSVSVFNGKIKAKNFIIPKNKGLVVSNKLKIVPLPKKVEKIFIKSGKIVKIAWQSIYKNFRIYLLKNNNISTIKEIDTDKKIITLDNLPDGRWYGKIQAIKDNLYSPFKKFTFISLINYYKALEAYKQNDILTAKRYLQKSIKTINNISYKPYYLYGTILLKENNNNGILYAKKACEIAKNNETLYLLAEFYFKSKNYKKIINILPKNTDNYKINLLLAKTYIKLNDIQKAKNYLYKILENKNDKIAEKLLLKLKPELLIQGK